MCSWCWGFRPALDAFRSGLPHAIEWRNLLGGLAPDSDVAMPAETRAMVMNHWRTIQARLGTEFNFDFWERCAPRRSTYPACRAVIAAGRQDAEEEMIDAIQRAYYLRAMNPSDDATLVQLAQELALDSDRFADDLRDPMTHQALLDQVRQARSMGVSSFPSLVFDSGGQRVRIPVDYHRPEAMLAAVRRLHPGMREGGAK